MLKWIFAKNYRNLDLDRGIDLSNLNVFVGSNGAGKTNLIELMEFFCEALTSPNSETSGMSRFEKAYFQSAKEFLDRSITVPNKINFGLRFDHLEKRSCLLAWAMELAVSSNKKPTIINEKLAELDPEILSGLKKPSYNDKQPFYYYQTVENQSDSVLVSVFDNNDEKSIQLINRVPANIMLLESITSLLEKVDILPSRVPIYETRRFLLEQVSKWRFYNANTMNTKSICEAEPKAGLSDIYVNPSGENLALVLHNLINDSIDFEEEINRCVKAIRPDSQKIRTALTGLLSLTVQWKVSGIADPFLLRELSDGTVRMLCWATILRSHKLPSLIVIEEPEVGIHPAWLKVLAEWIKLASERTQVIITTHSPDLLDCFTDRLENVYVFNKKQDDPHHFVIDRLSRDRFQSLLDEGWELGDIYRVGDPTLGGWPW